MDEKLSSSDVLFEWSYYCLHGQANNENALFVHIPTNLFQFSFWLEVLMMAKLQEKEVHENAIFYLHDQNYNSLFLHLNESQKAKLRFKASLCTHILNMNTYSGQSIIREVQEILLLARGLKHESEEKSLTNWLKKNCHFQFDKTVNIISKYLLRYAKVDKDLYKLNDITLTNIIVNRLCNHEKDMNAGEERKAWISFLVKENKLQIYSLLKEHLLKSNNIQNIQFFFQLISNFKIDQKPIYLSDTIDFLIPTFHNLQHQNLLSQYPFFEAFMLSNSCVRCLSLHQKVLIVGGQKPEESQQYLLAKQSPLVLSYFYYNPNITAKECLKYYLKESEFIFSKKNKGTELSNDPNPLFITLIKRKFWESKFHSKVLNIMVWILLDNWLSYVEELTRKQQINKKLTFSQYRLTQQLTVLQFMFNLPVGTFLNYYPIEMGLQWNLFNLPSFSSLLLSNDDFMDINWFSIVVNIELKNIINQEDGFELGYKILVSKGDFEKHFEQFFIKAIETKVGTLKRDPIWKKKLKWMMKIVEFYLKQNVYQERASNLKTNLLKMK